MREGRPSEVIYPERTNADGTRRRSSLWSISPGTSPEGKGRRESILNFFGRKGSVSDEVPEGQDMEHTEVEQKGTFRDVDLLGKKREE